jgi:beta-N-acetylhexosaminidase
MTNTASMPELRDLTLEEKVGQMVMIDFTGYRLPDSVAESFARRHWGGVILFVKNIESRTQVSALCAELQAVAGSPLSAEGGGPLPLLIGVDQEGGIVDRLPFDPLASSPGAMALGAGGRPERAAQVAEINGRALRSLGFNLNFAPCVDVNNNPLNPVIGVRSFGERVDDVVRFSRATAAGLRAAGIIPCAKHFPGHGDTALDSHLALPTVDQPRDRLDGVELAPYRALIEDGLEMIMTAHILYPALDSSGLPATLSGAILNHLLRGELGFAGVVITDSMAMKAVADHFGVGRAAVMAVRAGADIVLACGTPAAQEETVEALLEAARSGALEASRIDASVARILALKGGLAGRCEPPPTEAAEVIAEAAAGGVTVTRNDRVLPLPPRGTTVIAPSLLPVSQLGEIGAAFPLGALLGARGVEVRQIRFSLADESAADIETARVGAQDAERVVLCLYARGALSPFQRRLAEAVKGSGRPLAVVSLNSPYILADLPEVDAYVCTYGYARSSMEALADILAGRAAALGRLPVSIPGRHARGDGA